MDAIPPGTYFWPLRWGEKNAGGSGGGEGERGGRISGGRLGILGVVVEGAGLRRTKRGGWCVIGVWPVVELRHFSSCSIVGRGGVLGGEDGEGGSEEMVMASGGFGRRRLLVGCVESVDLAEPWSSLSSTSRSELVSSISSPVFVGIPAGRYGRRDRGEEYCVAGVALSAAGFCVELKLNLGAKANWDDDSCGACCWKRREDDGLGVGLVRLEVMKRCGDGVWAWVRYVRVERR